MTSKHSGKEGVALVIVLAMVVLLAGVVVAYFSQAMWSRQLSNSSMNQGKVDELARSSLDLIVGNLKQEIVNGSTVLPNPNPNHYPPVYMPTSNWNMVPKKNPVIPSTMPSLIRVSTPTQIAGPGVDYAASDAPSTARSSNGRSVSLSRWNKHFLLPRPTGAAATDATPITDFVAPSWVYVTDQGPVAPALAAPNNAVIGRYAFAIYDEGALLDINVAGYPGAMPANTTHPSPDPLGSVRYGHSLKGTLAFADLSQLTPTLTSAQIDQIVGWRDYASAKPSDAFPNFTFLSSNAAPLFDSIWQARGGNLQAVPENADPSQFTWNGQTDQGFLSRQQLVDFFQAASIDPEALQWLGTFSRAVTAPSWTPANPVQANNFSAPQYEAAAELPDSANRNISNVRFRGASPTVRHYNDDGTSVTHAVQVGTPLLRSRFSLAKLAWLGSDGPNSAAFNPSLSDAERRQAIRDCFGLEWRTPADPTDPNMAPYWDYVAAGSTPFAIKTLEQVAIGNLEPNFFEMLKAGILSGSLGKDPGRQTSATGGFQTGGVKPGNPSYEGPAGYQFGAEGASPGYSEDKDRHIIQIGCNIIDQYDADSLPSAIHFGAFFESNYRDQIYNTLYGNENLPYLSRLLLIKAEYPLGQLNAYLQPEIWNPHQPLAPFGTPTPARPTVFRTRCYGQAQTKWNFITAPSPSPPPSSSRPIHQRLRFGWGRPSRSGRPDLFRRR